MKKALVALLSIVVSLSAFADDTIIYKPVVTLDSDFSVYDSVVVVAIDSIVLEAGFECSANSTSSFHTISSPFHIDEPDLTLTPGTEVEPSGTLDGGYLVGTINGQPGVSPSGAATYSIPISLPAGNKGMVPQLSVSYNSQGGGGIMGRGWNLGGLSSISATGMNRYYDNESTAISSVDTVCRVVWDGQRLLALNNSGLEADSFRTEMLSNVKITTTGSGNTMWFTVKTPNGRTMEYGSTTDSRLKLGDDTQWKWMLSKVYDRNGNTIEYTYSKDESIGELLLSEIEYGGDTALPVNNVELHYVDRSDISYAYIHDDLVLNDQLLDSISIESNSDYYGSYGFTYDDSMDESLLYEIVQYDKDNYRFNSTSVSWEAPSFNINSTATGKSILHDDDMHQYTGDFTGDGIFDLVVVDLDAAHADYMYYLYEGSSSGLPSSPTESGYLPRSYTHIYWNELTSLFDVRCPGTASSTFEKKDISYVFSGDFDGDGIEELFVKVVEWDDLAPYLPEDLNSDFDHLDIIHGNGFYDDVCDYSTFFSTPITSDLGTGIGRILNLDESGTPGYTMHSFLLGTSSSYDKQQYQFPDMEGFGYNCIPDQDSLYYYHSGLDTMLAYVDIPENTTIWGEFNGDGKADYITYSYGSFPVKTYNPSTNSFATSDYVDGKFLGMIDLNGDGTTAWVGLDEDFELFDVRDFWDEYYATYSCEHTDNSCWTTFLEDYGLISAYDDYSDDYCSTLTENECRYAFKQNETALLSLGYKLYIKHLSGRGPDVNLGYFPKTTNPYDTILTRAVAVDINADGSNDLLVFNLDTLKKIYYDFTPSYSGGNLSYSYSSNTSNTLLDENMHFGDFNGDGIVEMVFPNSSKQLSFISSGKPGRLVSSITNGLGIESSYTYKPLTDTSVYTKESDASYPVIDFCAPWYVVSSMATDNGVADSTYIEYEYEGAKIHLQGKGLLGFMQTTVENDLQNSSQISSSDYNTDYFQTYPLSSLQKSGTNSVAQSSSYVSFDSLDVHYFKMQTDSVKNQNFLNGTATTSGFTYNTNGLVSEKKTKYGTTATVTENYSYTEAGWHVAALPEYISREYKRGNESAIDSSFLSYNDTTGNLIQKKEYCGTDQEMITRISGYDSFGNPGRISLTGKRGPNLAEDSVWTDMSYSADGRFLTSKSGLLDQKETYQYDYSSGVLESRTAPNRTETTYEYGVFNQQQKIIHPDLIEESSVVTWTNGHTYKPSGSSSLFYKWSKASGIPEVLTFYDEAGRVLRTVAEGFDNEVIYVDTEYDSQGRVSRKSMPYFNGESQYWTTYTYDSYGRISSDSSANSIVTSYTYNGLETQISITNGDSTYTSSTEVNALGETVESTDDANNTVTNLYYPDGKLLGSYVNTHSSDTTLFVYDAQGNRTSIKDPDAGTITSQYDAFGSLLRQISAKDDTATYLYDDIGRVTKQTDSRGDFNYSYISDTTTAAFGMIDSVYNSDKSLQEIFTYDSDYGMLLTQTTRQPGKAFTNSYTYDWFGRPLTRTYPSGFEIQYAYTSNGDLDQVSGEGLTLWNCSSVNVQGQVTGYSQGGYTSSLTYNNFGELNRVTTGSIVDMYYAFDDFGNLSSREDSKTLQEEKFTYDNLNRLTKIEYYDDDTYVSTADLSMGYDNCGNITSKTKLSTDIDYGEGTAGPHALTTINDPDASYTPVPQYITYNCFNKVSSITDTLSGGVPLTLDFSYGLNNQRIKTTKSRNSTIEKVKYFDMDYEEDSTSSGVKKYHYIHGGNGLTAIFVREGVANDTMYYVMSDHLGSLTTIVNATSSEVTKYSFNAWGIARDATDWTSAYTGELFAGRGFTGHEHLTEFNLINMNGRIYDPIMGRFLSPDPYVQAPNYPNNLNRYSYALNNPLIYTDPDGEWLHLLFGGLIGGTINLIANWKNADNFWQGLGYFGVGAAAGVATAAIGGAGIGAFEAAVFSGTASGGLIGGGNVAMQGGSGADIFAGAVGGALIGGSAAFLGASAMMGINAIGGVQPDFLYGGNSNIHFPGAGKIINPSIGDAVNYYSGGLSSKVSNFLSSNSSLLSNIGGGLGGVGAGNLFQFSSLSQPPELLFDGSKLHIVSADGVGVYRADAYSGRPLKDGTFDYSVARQQIANKGPIPTGGYYINVNEIQSITARDRFLGMFGRGAWRGSVRSWGEERAWIYALPGTNTYGRGGFTIHGGKVPGSAGCIDLVGNVNIFFRRLRRASNGQDRITLRVRY